MSTKTVPVAIDILGIHFRLGCPVKEEKRLRQAADMVTQHMLQVKNDGRVLGLDRMAVMVALNLACDLLALQQQKQQQHEQLSEEYQQQTQAIEQHLQRLQQQLANGLAEESTAEDATLTTDSTQH